jgi:hypothetical protein
VVSLTLLAGLVLSLSKILIDSVLVANAILAIYIERGLEWSWEKQFL